MTSDYDIDQYVLDDILCRFIFNLPKEEQTTDRIFFHIQSAHWFYTDFYQLNKDLMEAQRKVPKVKLKHFAKAIFKNCPFLKHSPREYFEQAFSRFNSYILEIPVYGAIIFNPTLEKVLLVTNFKNTSYSFPKGKINQNESGIECAIREVWEETGINIRPYISEKDVIVYHPTPNEKKTLYVIHGINENVLHKANTLTRNEIGKIEWVKLSEIEEGKDEYQFKHIVPFMKALKMWKRDYLDSNPKPVKIVTNPRIRSNSMNDAEMVENHISIVFNQALNVFKNKLNDIVNDSERRILQEPQNPFLSFELNKAVLEECFVFEKPLQKTYFVFTICE